MTEIVVCDKPQTPAVTPQSQARARGRILFDAKSCRACRVCELGCSIHKEGKARPAVARINIVFDEFQSVDPLSARICAQCENAPCIGACRVGAMSRDEHTGAVLIGEACVGCMRCQKACPWNIPQKHPDRRAAIKCDLCLNEEDGPACVRLCPLSGKALRYVPDYYERGPEHERV